MGVLGEFVWSEKKYTAESLLDTQLVKFPVIVKITQGYNGRNEVDRVTQGEVRRSKCN